MSAGVPTTPAPARVSSRALVPVRARSALAMALVFAVGIAAFGWPFVIEPGAALDTSHAADAPLLFVVLLPLLAAVLLAELTSGGMDAKAVALLGMLAAVGGALRALGPGTAGLEPTFVVLVLGGRVFGKGFGFVLGALTMFVGAVITGGVGPWLVFQMLAAGWVGFFAGCLPRAGAGSPAGPVAWAGGRVEVLLVAGYAAVASLAYGLVMNLWFWPFASYGPEVSYVAGDPAADNLARYLLFYLTTSLPWDLGRAGLCLVVLLLAGRSLLRALRRSARRAAFDAPVRFEPAEPLDGPGA